MEIKGFYPILHSFGIGPAHLDLRSFLLDLRSSKSIHGNA